MAAIDRAGAKSVLSRPPEGEPDMIIPPKEPATQVLFRLPPTLIREIDELAERTNRSRNDAVELLLRWAIATAKHELDAVPTKDADDKAKKKK